MQFLVLAKDGTDADALQRRLAARDSHIAYSDEAIKRGEQIIGAALLDENDQMNGSAMIVDFPNEAALRTWLEKEAYITGNVWQHIQIIPCKVGPSFSYCLK
jgi:uncharacterized protein YciI